MVNRFQEFRKGGNQTAEVRGGKNLLDTQRRFGSAVGIM